MNKNFLKRLMSKLKTNWVLILLFGNLLLVLLDPNPRGDSSLIGIIIGGCVMIYIMGDNIKFTWTIVFIAFFTLLPSTIIICIIISELISANIMLFDFFYISRIIGGFIYTIFILFLASKLS
jgi:hypothetical protein